MGSVAGIKVARVIARLNTGGPAIHAIALARELPKKGFECCLLTGVVSQDEGDMTPVAIQEGIKLIMIPTLSREISLMQDVQAFFRLVGELRKWRPHILHTHTAKAGALGRLAGLLTRIPVRIHTFHGHVFHGYFGYAKTQVFLLVERILAYFTDALVVLSTSQMRELVDTYHIALKPKFNIIPLGFDFSSFDPEKISQENKRGTWGLTPQHYICGFIGRLEPIKNPLLFVRAFQGLVEQREARSKALAVAPEALAAVIVGSGSLDGSVRTCIEGLECRAQLKMVGWQKDMAHIYSALDVVVLPSLNEGTPVALIEAMAAGKPFVATNVGGVEDLMVGKRQVVKDKDGHQFMLFENGILVESRDLDGIRGALGYLMTNQEQGHQMGRIGRSFALKYFNLNRLVDDVHHLYLRELHRKNILKG
jgi:glycosyltransferase involved in cell wall biosynthesis